MWSTEAVRLDEAYRLPAESILFADWKVHETFQESSHVQALLLCETCLLRSKVHQAESYGKIQENVCRDVPEFHL